MITEKIIKRKNALEIPSATRHMETIVFFNSDGIQIAGVLFEPEAAANDSCPAIMLCQGMVGVKEYFWFPHLSRRLVELGCVALIWDYRGVGESEGEPGRLYPLEQAEDIRNGLTFLENNRKVDPDRLGLLGFSFGAGMVPYVAGIDERVKCAISVAGWGDGKRWMQSIRRYYEWLDLLGQIDDDRKTRIESGNSQMVRGGGCLGGRRGSPASVGGRRAERAARRSLAARTFCLWPAPGRGNRSGCQRPRRVG